MANKHPTLSSLFSAMANSLRKKTGSNDGLVADNFPEIIDSIASPADGSIPTRTSDDLSVNREMVIIPSGYYNSEVRKSVHTVTQGVPTIGVDSSGSVTATVSQGAGYVYGGTKTASEQLPTIGNTVITPTKSSQVAVSSGTYTTGTITVEAIPDNYITTDDATASSSALLKGETAYVNGKKITGDIETKTSSNLTASNETVTVPAGYYASDVSKSVSKTGLGAPSIIVGTNGVITATVQHSASGWVDADTKSNTVPLSTQAAKTVTPSASSQTAVAKGKYTTGEVKVAAVPTQAKTVNPEASSQVIYPDSGKFLSSVTVLGDSDLVPANIVSGKTIFNVTGAADVLETNAPFTYSVNSISGAQYGFALGGDGYYESLNKGVNNSFAICRVNLNVKTACNLTFDVINYAESTADYAIFGLLGVPLGLNNSVDSDSKCHKKFSKSSDNSSSVVNVTYALTAGSHFIDIKFRKDSSLGINNDSVKFKVQYNYSLPGSTLQKIQQLDPNLVSSNIKSGVDIFGVPGELSPSSTTIEQLSSASISNGYLYFYPSQNISILKGFALSFARRDYSYDYGGIPSDPLGGGIQYGATLSVIAPDGFNCYSTFAYADTSVNNDISTGGHDIEVGLNYIEVYVGSNLSYFSNYDFVTGFIVYET